MNDPDDNDHTARRGLASTDLSGAFGRRSEGLKGLLRPAAVPDQDQAAAEPHVEPRDEPRSPAADVPSPTAPNHPDDADHDRNDDQNQVPAPRARKTTSRRPARKTTAPSGDEPATTIAAQPDSPPPTPATATRPVAPAASESSDGARKGMVIYAPLSVRDQLTAFRTRHNLTITDVVLDAFDATYDQLPDIYTQQSPQERREGSLFERPASRRPVHDEDPLVQIFVSLSAKNRAVISRIAATVAPGNTRARSRVCALALQTYLAQQIPERTT